MRGISYRGRLCPSPCRKAVVAVLWFTSDLHLGDESIARHARRPWKTAGEMNDALIDAINASVKPSDQLYILGDFSYKLPRDKAEGHLRRIACEHVHLVCGNHDEEWRAGDLFESVDGYLELKSRGRKLCLMHYPLLTWNGIYRESIHLHGHIHSRGPSYNRRNRSQGYFRYDVGVDANEYRPVSLAELLAFYKDAQAVTPRRDAANLGAGRRAGDEDGDACGPSELLPLDDGFVRLVPADQMTPAPVVAYFKNNRAALALTEPERDASFYTEAGWRDILASQAREIKARRGYHWYVECADEPGAVWGTVSLNKVSWGVFRSAYLGFRGDCSRANRGMATAAVRLASTWALGEAGLHRIEANVLPGNAAALRVLEKCGYGSEGTARGYLNVGGVWEDHMRLVLLSGVPSL